MKKALFYFPIALLALLISACGNSQRSPKQQNSDTKAMVNVPNFNADSAYAFVAKQVDFGPRVPGTPAHAACEEWLVKKFKEYSDTVIVQRFQAQTYDGVMRKGANIIASFEPNNPKRILLMAHWDSRPFADHDKNPKNWKKPIEAANDGASGVGVLMEMARQFRLHHPNVGVDIVLFDLEDWGPPKFLNFKDGEDFWALGAQYWAHHPQVPGYSARFGILLDMVGAKNAHFPKEYFSRQYAGYYVDMIWRTARALGYDNYFVNTNGDPIDDDHLFVNKIAGIPSVDIIQLDPNSSNGTFWEYWHTTHDTLNKIDKQTLKVVGQVLLNVVYNQ
ncbi:MAG: M28 family peptidase [Bacteroidales bacterium]|nr:M28 family peptidase [Bacteroidales bacterium]